MFEENGTSNKTVQCNLTVKEGALFEFVTCGILLQVIGIFGLFGNIISMIILSRPQMKSSINYLLIGMARCDTILIIMSILLYGLPAIESYTGLLFNYKTIVFPRLAKYLFPLSMTAQMVTVYLTLTITMERYIAVCHPLRARYYCTCGRARVAILCIIIASTIYNLPKFWEVEIYDEEHWKYNVTIYCVRGTDMRNNELYVAIYIHWMYFVVLYAFPFVALLIFNLAIYRQVRKANHDLQHMSRHQRREIGLATMLLCVVVVFLICNILPLVTNFYESLFDEENPLNWMADLGNLTVTINSSVNFIIYVIFGRKFKRIFLQLFCSSGIFGPGRESPEYPNDESVMTNTTNIELRNSIRRCHLHRSSTNYSRNNNIPSINGNTRQLSVNGKARSSSPGPCIYYPARSPVRSPSQISRSMSAQNGWDKNNIAETTLQ